MSAAKQTCVVYRNNNALAVCIAAVLLPAVGGALRAEDSPDLRKQVESLQQQNAELKDRLREQRTLIDGLTHKVAEIQHGAMFTPHVLPVVAGTVVEWPNNDDILHNVFSMSETKPFDLGLYKKCEPGKQVVFDKAGRVDVYCSIHASMNCVILVLQNPFFATSDEQGRYSITNVPPGTYKLKAWHERLPPLVQEITVPKSGEAKMDFVLGIKDLPKY